MMSMAVREVEEQAAAQPELAEVQVTPEAAVP
jgi:hypothetical protein